MNLLILNRKIKFNKKIKIEYKTLMKNQNKKWKNKNNKKKRIKKEKKRKYDLNKKEKIIIKMNFYLHNKVLNKNNIINYTIYLLFLIFFFI